MPKPWWTPSVLDEIHAAPWLSPEATAFLESILFAEMDVIEHGSGGSTLWLASRVKSVTSFEHDDDWRRRIEKANRPNVKIYGHHEKEPLRAKLFDIHQCDLLFIDGEPVEDRSIWLSVSYEIVKRGGWIVLDNANRPEYKAERDALANFADLKYTSPLPAGTKYLTTEFWQVRE